MALWLSGGGGYGASPPGLKPPRFYPAMEGRAEARPLQKQHRVSRYVLSGLHFRSARRSIKLFARQKVRSCRGSSGVLEWKQSCRNAIALEMKRNAAATRRALRAEGCRKRWAIMTHPEEQKTSRDIDAARLWSGPGTRRHT